jgi:tRNA(Ile2) C34 agmatinyltransferase TiaS
VEIECERTLLSFAQGGDVNKLSQNLQPGDEIEWLGLADPEGSIHLEKLRLVSGGRNKSRPICDCGTRYKSQGQNQSLRCPNCGSKHPDEWVYELINSDWKEPPASHRRHLSKPLTRRGKSED